MAGRPLLAFCLAWSLGTFAWGEATAQVLAPYAAAPAATAHCCQPDCTPKLNFWGRLDYLHWWTKGANVPPLVTSSTGGADGGDELDEYRGILGEPDTILLFGNQSVFDDARSGIRLSGGVWLDDERTLGFEGSLFWLDDEHLGFAARSEGEPTLARPFFDVFANESNSQLVAFPDVLRGAVSVQGTSELWGGELLVRTSAHRGCGYEVWLVGGYRYLRLAEDLRIAENLEVLDPDVPAGTRIGVRDYFDAGNEFHGFDLGVVGERCMGPVTLELRAKLAFGVNRQSVAIRGGTRVDVPGEPAVNNVGGLLALKSNIGEYERDEFTVLPELGVTATYAFCRNCGITFGYSFLYLSNVVRAGDQIDLNVNPELLPPAQPRTAPARPSFQFNESDFWAQGLRLGLEIRY